MTSVGTPIYVAPEVMAGYAYDATADSYSFGICLVAMIRAGEASDAKLSERCGKTG